MLRLIKADLIQTIIAYTKYQNIIIEEPKKGPSDLAIPLFNLVKNYQVDLNDLYLELVNVLKTNRYFSSANLLNGFLNIYLNRQLFLQEFKLSKILKPKKANGQVVVIDYSSPNIAKFFSVGHLRSTIIGHSLKHIYTFLGYKVIGINHLGDWGTQFGKIIYGYLHWGDPQIIAQNPLLEIQKLYVKFHEEAKNDPTLEDEARKISFGLEHGNLEYLKLWNYFKEESLKEFGRMYDILNVHFDYITGESFFNDKIAAVIEELKNKHLANIDDGALIVKLDGDLPPALIKRGDDTTLYIARDLTALLYRLETFHFQKILYVVGNEQKLHFQQLQNLVQKMGYDLDIQHINFGLVLMDGHKLSTREGKFAKLEELIDYTKERIVASMKEKNPHIKISSPVVKRIAMGAIIFNDLKNDRVLNINFNIEAMSNFTGNTGPYIQYTIIRIKSLEKLKNIKYKNLDYDWELLSTDKFFNIFKTLAKYAQVIDSALVENQPSQIGKYLLGLANDFNNLYATTKIHEGSEIEIATKLYFVNLVRKVLSHGLGLLGILIPSYM
ncbi:MAG: arginine--tRNA ligase [Acholeplasmatales bacterium]|jgi:arginyl-tRNA synthetase|nr:arginine--tRNA ligase [Acholeplasmatales bacterium]